MLSSEFSVTLFVYTYNFSFYLSLSLSLLIYFACYGFCFVFCFCSFEMLLFSMTLICVCYIYLNWPTDCLKCWTVLFCRSLFVLELRHELHTCTWYWKHLTCSEDFATHPHSCSTNQRPWDELQNCNIKHDGPQGCHCIDEIQMRITHCDWRVMALEQILWRRSKRPWRWRCLDKWCFINISLSMAPLYESLCVPVCYFIRRVQIYTYMVYRCISLGCAPFYLSVNLNFRSPSRRRMFSSHCMVLPWQSSRMCIHIYTLLHVNHTMSTRTNSRGEVNKKENS